MDKPSVLVVGHNRNDPVIIDVVKTLQTSPIVADVIVNDEIKPSINIPVKDMSIPILGNSKSKRRYPNKLVRKILRGRKS